MYDSNFLASPLRAQAKKASSTEDVVVVVEGICGELSTTTAADCSIHKQRNQNNSKIFLFVITGCGLFCEKEKSFTSLYNKNQKFRCSIALLHIQPWSR